MATYELKDEKGNIIETYNYPDPLPFVDSELQAAIDDLKTYIGSLPSAQRDGLMKLFKIIKRLAQGSGLQE